LYLDVLVSCFWNHSCNMLLTGFVSGGADPTQRFSLEVVANHPWVVDKE
jgi:hypothetical protein